MSSRLPDRLDPWRAVESHAIFVGRLPLSSLPRLQGLLLDNQGDVVFKLEFLADDQSRALVRCEVAATLSLCCQRCLEALQCRVDTSATLAIVVGVHDERQVPERYDPLLVSDEPLRPRDLIEDELLLALPQIPMHDPVSCTVRSGVVERVPELEPECDRGPRGTPTPFSVLGQLKSKG